MRCGYVISAWGVTPIGSFVTKFPKMSGGISPSEKTQDTALQNGDCKEKASPVSTSYRTSRARVCGVRA